MRIEFRLGFQRETVYAVDVDGREYRVCVGVVDAFTRDGEPFDPVAAGHWKVLYSGTVRCESGPPGAHFPPREVVAALSATERIPLVGARFDPAAGTVVYDGPTPPLPVRVHEDVWEDPRYAALCRYERAVTDEELARLDPDAPYVPGTLARTVRTRVDAWVRAQWPGVLPEPTPPVLDAAIPF